MTNSEKLKEINQYLGKFISDARREVNSDGLNSAKWIYAKSRYDTVCRIEAVIQEIVSD